MNRRQFIKSLLVFCLLATQLFGCAAFNGTSAYLLTANNLVGGSTPGYPVLVGAWIKLSDVANPYPILWATDNAALGSIDYLSLEARGDIANDPVRAAVAANGSGNVSAATTNGLTTGTWVFVGAYYASNASRAAVLGSTTGTAETTSRAATGFTHASVGTQYFGSAPNGFFNGRVAEFLFASGFAPGDINTIVSQLAAGKRPINVPQLSGFINAYQPLRTGLNDVGFIGPTWTNNNVTFDSTDHPTMFANGQTFYYYRGTELKRPRLPGLFSPALATTPVYALAP